MIDRRAFFLLPAVLIGACTPEGHSVPQDSIRQYHVADVVIRGAEHIFSWPAQEKIVIGQNKLSQQEQSELTGRGAGTFPPLREQMEKTMRELFTMQANNQLRGVLSGSKPATLIVNVKMFDIPSVARKVIVGGHARKHFEIDLVDKASGTPIVRYEGLLGQNVQLQGLASIAEAAIQGDKNDPAPEMIRSEVETYRTWLAGSSR
ncbi:MAG: hypothetical protein LCH39_07050 [Proteobacteria bacterium]|nr:hypothetical protein [Pseudomonadota bacterium]